MNYFLNKHMSLMEDLFSDVENGIVSYNHRGHTTSTVIIYSREYNYN